MALATAFFLNFSVKSLSSKVVQKFRGEVAVLSLPLRGGSTRLKIAWVQQRQHHKAQESARERMLSLALR